MGGILQSFTATVELDVDILSHALAARVSTTNPVCCMPPMPFVSPAQPFDSLRS